MRPVSKTIRRQLGAFDNSKANCRCRRLRLALVNHHPFAIETANMRLVHRDIEASEILHIGSPLPYPGQSYRPMWKSSRPLPDVEKLRLIEAPGADSLLLGGGDSVDDGRTASDARGAVLWLQA